MNLIALIIAVIASAAVAGGGYLVGARRGVRARDALRHEAENLKHQVAAEGARLEQLAGELAAARRPDTSAAQAAELHSVVGNLSQLLDARTRAFEDVVKQSMGTLSRDLDSLGRKEANYEKTLGQHLHSLRKSMEGDLQEALKPLQGGGNARLDTRLEELLQPMAAAERLGRTLAALKVDGGRRDLPRMMSVIKETCGLSDVVLADGGGLPIASTDGAREVELIAGVSGSVFQLSERVRLAEHAVPNVVIIRDDTNRYVLFRMFSVDDEPYVLIAARQGYPISAEMVDPAVPAISKLLTTESWNAMPYFQGAEAVA